MANFQTGLYHPSFLSLKVDTYINFDNIRELDDSVKAVYFHEYTHFLQDITTAFGLNNMWQTYDRIRQVIYEAQNCKEDLVIPMNSKTVVAQYDLFKARESILGDKGIKELVGANRDISVVDVTIDEDENIERVLPNGKIKILRVKLQSENEDLYDYSFGASAVMESMAYLMEQKFGIIETGNLFPYCSVKKLASYVCERISLNDEYIFALCDIALMSNYPGINLYLILLEIRNKDFYPNCSKDIYTFGNEVLKENGWNILKEYEISKQEFLLIFNQIYNLKEFEPTRIWLNTLIEESFEFRKNNIAFLLDLFIDKPFGNNWEMCVSKLGFPEMHNAESKRWFSAPLDLRDIEDSIHPIFLLAFWQLEDTLLSGQTSCKLISFCSESNQKDFVDDNCRVAPWKKFNKEKLCSFCSLWGSFGLHKKNIIQIKLVK
jgi:hypothetical protein